MHKIVPPITTIIHGVEFNMFSVIPDYEFQAACHVLQQYLPDDHIAYTFGQHGTGRMKAVYLYVSSESMYTVEEVRCAYRRYAQIPLTDGCPLNVVASRIDSILGYYNVLHLSKAYSDDVLYRKMLRLVEYTTRYFAGHDVTGIDTFRSKLSELSAKHWRRIDIDRATANTSSMIDKHLKACYVLAVLSHVLTKLGSRVVLHNLISYGDTYESVQRKFRVIRSAELYDLMRSIPALQPAIEFIEAL